MSRARLTAGAWAATVGLAAVALGIGQLLVSRPEVPTGTSVARADVGQELVAAGVRVVVLEAGTAPELVVAGEDGDSAPLTTTGRWLVLRVAVTGENAPADTVSYDWVDDDGVRYDLSERVDRGHESAQPGEWWHEDLVFEVPERATAGGTLRVQPEGVVRELPMEIGEVRVDAVAPSDSIEPVALSPGRS